MVEGITLKYGEDQLIWLPSARTYSTGDGRKVLCSRIQSSNVHWKCIWKLKTPPKVQLFVWKLEHRIIPTKVLLMKRTGCAMANMNCSVCDLTIEIQDHTGISYLLRKSG